MRWKAVIFDLDGTLLETERMVIGAGLAAMGRLGFPERRDVLESMVGTVADEAEAVLRLAYGPAFDPAAFETAWGEEFSARLSAGIPLRPGVPELLGHLDALSMPRAVATNSRTEPARTNLTTAGILGFFGPDRVHGRDQVDRPKPAPDLFLHAAARLGVDPADCLAFEDSDPGAEAAVAAGMTVVLVPDQRPPVYRGAHHLADSLIAGARAARLME